MLQSVLRRLRESQTAEIEGMEAADAGFTLIELMVVLLIIAILLAIAIPTFLGVTSSANDRAAQSNLTNGLTEAASQYQANAQTYTGVSAALSASAPEFTWTASNLGCSTSQPNCISVDPIDLASANDQQGVIIASMSKTGTCWYVAQLQANPVAIASGETSPNVAFITAAWASTPAAGMQENVGGTANLSTAGTYYAKRTTSTTAQCDSAYPLSVSGFKWGSSFSAPGID